MPLLEDIKNYLDITWEDYYTDSKLEDIILRGKAYIDSAAGEALDYDADPKARELLFDYCRYARENALDKFQTNYLHELLSLQISKEVERYVDESADL